MSRILAIEADPKRRVLLATLIRDHISADLTVVTSVSAALTILARQTPDVILAPTLLSPKDSADLLDRVRMLDAAAFIQIVTLPALDMLAEAPKAAPRTFLRWRKPVSLGLQYDPSMVVAQIADGLERSRVARADHEAMLAHAEWRKLYPELAEIKTSALVPMRFGTPAALAAASVVGSAAQSNDERRTALRRRGAELPWLSDVKLAWGSDVALVNISSSGILLETGSKFTPGSTTDLTLRGPETNLVVPVKFIRSEVARIDGLGVKYHAAAAFARELDLAAGRAKTVQQGGASPQALADLLTDALEAGAHDEAGHVRFTRGLRQLLKAKDVQVRRGGATSAGGRETLYFDVPGDTRTTLQVVFDRGRDVSDSDFRLLKAAAWMTAAVLELEKPDADAGEAPEVRLLAEQVA